MAMRGMGADAKNAAAQAREIAARGLGFQNAHQQAQAPAGSGMTSGQQSAWEFIRSRLDQWGLAGLSEMVKNFIVNGSTQDEAIRKIRETPEHKTRFAGMAMRAANGFPPIDEASYLGLEGAYAEVMRQYGLPQGLYDDPTDFAQWIGKSVSREEMAERVGRNYNWALNNMDREEAQQLQALYGVTVSDMAAWALDPDRALPFFEQRRAAVEVAGQAARTGWGQLTTAEAESLVTMGVDEADAAKGFATLATVEPLFTEQIGETGGDFTREQQLSTQFGNDVEQQRRLSRRARARLNAAQAGGGALTTNAGASGLGTSS